MGEGPTYQPGLTYICVKDCGTQITVNSFGEGRLITCCGEAMKRGRVIAVTPKVPTEGADNPSSAYRLLASPGELDPFLQRYRERLVLVEFSAPWCGACKAMDPVLDQVAAAYPGKVQLLEINVDEDRHLPRRFGVLSVPALLFIRDGEVKGRLTGQQDKTQVEALVGKLL